MANNSSNHDNVLSSVDSKWVVLLILGIGIIVANSLVLIAARRNKALRRQGRVYIVSLAITDLLAGLIACPFHVYWLLGRMPVTACYFAVWSTYLCETASIISLTVISVDRCFKISYPFHYKAKVTTRKCTNIVGVIWLYSVITATIAIVPYNNQTKMFLSPTGECLNPKPMFYLLFFTINFILPCVIMASSYIVIFIVAYRRRRKWSEQQDLVSGGERRVFLKDLKNARTLGTVVLIFIICWGPPSAVWAFMTYYSQMTGFCRNRVLCFVTTAFLPLGNSLCNPIIYGLCDQEYRRDLKKAFKQIFKKWQNIGFFFLVLYLL